MMLLSRRAVARLSALPLSGVGRTPQIAYLRHSSAPLAQRVTLDTPYISGDMPLPEGILGSVEELLLEVGDMVSEGDIVAVVDTAKVSLEVKASRSGVVTAVLVELGDEIKEQSPIYELE